MALGLPDVTKDTQPPISSDISHIQLVNNIYKKCPLLFTNMTVYYSEYYRYVFFW